MITNKTVAAVAVAAVAVVAMVWASSCSERGTANSHDKDEHRREQSAAADASASQPAELPATDEAVGAALAAIDVPEDTLEGEWLEIGGLTPYRWCYRGGRRLDFRQDGPRIYLAVDGGEHEMVGIVVRSREEAELLSQEAAKSPQPLCAWVYSGQLPWLTRVEAPEKVDAIQVWEFDYALLKDLSPLEHFAGLESLSLRNCRAVADLAPLGKLAKLASLDLTRCEAVTSGDTLAGLEGLRWLSIDATGIGRRSNERTDLSFLSGLTKLRHLDLGNKQSADYKFLVNFSELESLVGVNGFLAGDSFAEALAGLPHLKYLGIDSPHAVNLPPSLSNLRSLNMDYCGRLDFNRLRHLTSLKSLTCEGLTGTVDLTPLARLAELEHLSLSHWSRDKEGQWRLDLKPLSGMTRLSTLKLEFDDNVSMPLDPLAELQSLSCLEIDAWNIPGIAPVGKLAALKRLRLHIVDPGFSDLRIADLSGLSSLDLNVLTITPNQPTVTAIPAMAKLTSLRELTVAGDIQDISAVAELPGLRELKIVDHQVEDFRALERSPRLRRLVIDKGCSERQLSRIIARQPALEELEVESLTEPDFDWDHGPRPDAKDYSEVLGRLKHLRRLKIGNLHDLSLLEGMGRLVSVEVRYTRAMTAQPLAGLRHLRRCNILLPGRAYLAAAAGKEVDFATPVAQLDELLELRGIATLENIKRQVERGTKVHEKGGDEMREELFQRERRLASP
jgi:Leucine-rich repeat (LRR) protein